MAFEEDQDHARFAPVLASARAGEPDEKQLATWVRMVHQRHDQFAREAAATKIAGEKEELNRRVKVLRYYVDELELCLDVFRVAETKRQAKEIYVEAGRNATLLPTDPDGQYEAPSEYGLGALTPDSQAQFANIPPNAAAAGAQFGLDDAEILAIITYCFNDFTYINPATAFNAAWMVGAAKSETNKGNVQYGSLRQRLEEGGLHVGMLMSALKKLPNVTASTFRGELLSRKMFADRFDDYPHAKRIAPKTSSTVNAASWSTSRASDTPTGFIAGANDEKPIAMMYELDVNNGRDIMAFSPYQGEAEVLCPPGSVYVYGNGRKVDPAMFGVGAQYECFVVPVTQTWSQLP